MDSITSLIDTVRTYESDIDQTKHDIATINEQIKDEVESTAEYMEVERLTEALKIAKEKLRLALSSNGHYNDLLETKGQLNDTLKDQKEVLSEHLVAYFGMTQERQIELGDGGEAREVVLSGKLGKEGQYQTNMFAKQNGGRNE